MDTTTTWIRSRPIAHRGLHQGQAIPENSLRAFAAAVDRQYAIELDVFLTTDHQPVVFHDRDLRRLTGAVGTIDQMKRSHLRTLRLLGSDQHIPLLDEVLELVAGQVPLLIELKNAGLPGRMEQVVCQTLKHYRGTYAIQSFNPFSLLWFRRHAPSMLRGQLASDFADVVLAAPLKYLLGGLWLNPVSAPHFIGYDIRCLPVPAVSVARAHGLPLVAWTVRTDDEYRKAQRLADNIIFEDLLPEIPAGG